MYDSIYAFENDFPALIDNREVGIDNSEQNDEDSGSLVIQRNISGHWLVF